MSQGAKEAAITFLLASASFLVAQIVFANIEARFPKVVGK